MTHHNALPNWLSWLPFGTVPSIMPALAARQLHNYLIIDVRTPQEYQKSHIPGAISIPLHTLSQQRISTLPHDKPIICICLSAHRSKPATRKLMKAGFNAQELSGGMLAWWKQSLPLEH